MLFAKHLLFVNFVTEEEVLIAVLNFKIMNTDNTENPGGRITYSITAPHVPYSKKLIAETGTGAMADIFIW